MTDAGGYHLAHPTHEATDDAQLRADRGHDFASVALFGSIHATLPAAEVARLVLCLSDFVTDAGGDWPALAERSLDYPSGRCGRRCVPNPTS